ncbi:unnamed protein product, partial [Iphiclides podalirius]
MELTLHKIFGVSKQVLSIWTNKVLLFQIVTLALVAVVVAKPGYGGGYHDDDDFSHGAAWLPVEALSGLDTALEVTVSITASVSTAQDTALEFTLSVTASVSTAQDTALEVTVSEVTALHTLAKISPSVTVTVDTAVRASSTVHTIIAERNSATIATGIDRMIE